MRRGHLGGMGWPVLQTNHDDDDDHDEQVGALLLYSLLFC